MQYYYDCVDGLGGLAAELQRQSAILRNYDERSNVIHELLRKSTVSILAMLHDNKIQESMPSVIIYRKKVADLQKLVEYKALLVTSLFATTEWFMCRIRKCMHEFACEVDAEAPGTSADLERRNHELQQKIIFELDAMRDKFPIFNSIVTKGEVAISTAEFQPYDGPGIMLLYKNASTKVVKGSVGDMYHNLAQEFGLPEDPNRGMLHAPSSSSASGGGMRRSSIKVKLEKRPAPASTSPSPFTARPAKIPKLPKVEVGSPIPSPYPGPSSSSSSVASPSAPLAASVSSSAVASSSSAAASVSALAGASSSSAYDYNTSVPSQPTFSTTMPSFSGSQESRHGRQRKFTPKAQMMFKDNKLGPGRPSHQHHHHHAHPSGKGGAAAHAPQRLAAAAAAAATVSDFHQQNHRMPTPTSPLVQNNHIKAVRGGRGDSVDAIPYAEAQASVYHSRTHEMVNGPGSMAAASSQASSHPQTAGYSAYSTSGYGQSASQQYYSRHSQAYAAGGGGGYVASSPQQLTATSPTTNGYGNNSGNAATAVPPMSVNVGSGSRDELYAAAASSHGPQPQNYPSQPPPPQPQQQQHAMYSHHPSSHHQQQPQTYSQQQQQTTTTPQTAYRQQQPPLPPPQQQQQQPPLGAAAYVAAKTVNHLQALPRSPT